MYGEYRGASQGRNPSGFSVVEELTYPGRGDEKRNDRVAEVFNVQVGKELSVIAKVRDDQARGRSVAGEAIRQDAAEGGVRADHTNARREQDCRLARDRRVEYRLLKSRVLEPWVLQTPDDDDPMVLAYKKVANKVRPVPGILPEEFRIVRRRPPDPLKGLTKVPRVPLPIRPTGKLTQERIDELDIDPSGFLTPDEKKLVVNVIMMQEKALAWDETERGTLDPKYFDPI